MRIYLLACLLGLTVIPANAVTCHKGVLYRSATDTRTVLVKRIGTGMSPFSYTGPAQPGMALDLITPLGQRGAIYGPMRSYMFITDLRNLTEQKYKWRAADADPGGFFRILTGDGKREFMTLTYVGCAR